MTDTNTVGNKTLSNEQQLIQANKGFTLSRREFMEIAGAVGALAGLAVVVPRIGFAQVTNSTTTSSTTPSPPSTDQWIGTMCTMCNADDAVLVHVVNGVPVNVEGDPRDQLSSNGKLCAKGIAGVWVHNDPYRLKVPLKRVGPKGASQIPQWTEISWDEAYSTIVNNLNAVRAKGASGIVYYSNTSAVPYSPWWAAFKTAAEGTNTNIYMNMNFCGEVCHYMNRLAHGAFSSRVDFKYCNYVIYSGYSNGIEGGHGFVPFAYRVAEARARGMKVIDLDPRQGIPGAKADEWYPVYPATEGAFASAMLEVMLHELNIYDAPFVKAHTNGPYLVGSNGYFARDATTQKPLIWDPVANSQKTYDDPTIQDYALTGSYTVNGDTAKPSFQMLMDAVAAFTPEWAEGVTGISAADIRRITNEFITAAKIGSTVTINGKVWPYRPAAMESYASNAANHLHGPANGWSIFLVNTLIGNQEVPGGPQNAWSSMFQVAGVDGMIQVPPSPYGPQLRPEPPYVFSYPPKYADLKEFFPHGDTANMAAWAFNNPNVYGGATQQKIEFMFHFANNGMLSMYDQPQMENVWSAVPFNVDIELNMNENAQAYADIVLPDKCYLEKYAIGSTTDTTATTNGNSWFQQPVVDAPTGIPDAYDIFSEIANRAGFLYGKGGFYDAINNSQIHNPKLFPDITVQHTQEDFMDAMCKATFGMSNGLQWAETNGGNRGSQISPYMSYANINGKSYRLPIYVEEHKRSADALKANMDKAGVQWDYEDYFVLPMWIPSHIHQSTPPYDLIAMSYLQPMYSYTWNGRIPVIAEAAENFDPYALYVWMNADTASARGISDGDWVWVESEIGKAKAKAKLSQAIHPQVIGINRSLAGWVGNSVVTTTNKNYSPIAYETLRPNTIEYTDKLTGALENLYKVRVYKAT
jgi:anaerobic selenocysteine-containing dehydrogenase